MTLTDRGLQNAVGKGGNAGNKLSFFFIFTHGFQELLTFLATFKVSFAKVRTVSQNPFLFGSTKQQSFGGVEIKPICRQQFKSSSTIYVFDGVENIVGIGENAGYQH